MYKEGKAIRNKDGKIVKAASYQSREVPKAVIEPNRRWFNNTRVRITLPILMCGSQHSVLISVF